MVTMVGRGYPELYRERGRAQEGMSGSGRWGVSARALWAEMVAQSDPLLGEHGGGVKGAASSAPVLLPERAHPLPTPHQSPCEQSASATPLYRAPPIPAERPPLWPRLCQSEATQTLGTTPASAGSPIGADTNSGTPQSPSHGPAVRSAGTGRAVLPVSAAGQSGGTQTTSATPPGAAQPIQGDVNRRWCAP